MLVLPLGVIQSRRTVAECSSSSSSGISCSMYVMNKIESGAESMVDVLTGSLESVSMKAKYMPLLRSVA